MTEEILVLTTCGSTEEAERVAHTLVEEHLAACVNIVPGIRSIYRWQGAVEDASELLLVIKTGRDRLDSLTRRLREVHSYEVPEAIALPIVGGLEEYLAWMRSVLQSGPHS